MIFFIKIYAEYIKQTKWLQKFAAVGSSVFSQIQWLI